MKRREMVKNFQKILEVYENSKLDMKAANAIFKKLEKLNMVCLDNAKIKRIPGTEEVLITFEWER